jgi:hypothetical protein
MKFNNKGIKNILLLVLVLGMYGFVGIFQNPNTAKKLGCPSGTRGNGKTMCVTKYCALEYKKGAECFTNYYTKFSHPMSFHDIIIHLNDNKKYYERKKIVIGLTELYAVLKPYDSSIRKNFYSEFINQIRKFHATLYWDTQRLGDIAPTIRDNTNRISMPYKIHEDGQTCMDEQCRKHHYIIVDQYIPEYKPNLDVIDSNIYGKLYNSFDNQIIKEPLLE